MTKKFLVAVSVAEDDVKFSNFKEFFTSNMQEVSQDQFEVHVDYVTTVKEIEGHLEDALNEYDLVITYDNLHGISIGKGTLKKWRKAHPDTKFILLLPNEKRGRGKMAFFYEMGYYDAVFYSDFTVPFILDMLDNNRSAEEACIYYGISYKQDSQDVAQQESTSDEEPRVQAEEDIAVDADIGIQESNDGLQAVYTEIPPIAKDEVAKQNVSPVNDRLSVSDGLGSDNMFFQTKDDEFEEDDDIYGDDLYSESSEEYETEEEPAPMADANQAEVYTEMVFRAITKTDPATYNSWNTHMRTDQEFDTYIKKQIEIFEIPDEYVAVVYDSLHSFFWGYDVLTPLLDEVEISDIHVNNTNSIYVRRQGRLYKTDVHFRSDDHYRSFVNQFATNNNKSIEDDDAIVTFTDSKHPSFHQRVTLTTEYLTATGLPYLRIRKTSKIKYTFSQLIGFEMLDEKTAAYLIEKVNDDYCFLISGKGGSGKSILTNTCIDVIRNDKSGLVIQENFELFTDRDDLDMMFENLMIDNSIKKGDVMADGSYASRTQYDLKKLATMGLLQDLDYFIISETKGSEALEFINLYYSGHRCWTTLHSDHAVHNLDKLVGYAMPGSLYSKEELMQMVCSHAVLIHMNKFKIDEIVEACGWDEDNEKVIYKEILMLNKNQTQIDNKEHKDKSVA